jgi:hypothetical protein
MLFDIILESQVVHIIDANKKVSTGSDNIPAILLQWASHLIAKLLANIMVLLSWESTQMILRLLKLHLFIKVGIKVTLIISDLYQY